MLKYSAKSGDIMEKEKGKYKLMCIINNNMNHTHTLKSGSIEEIDKYIYDNKIKNSDDLYDRFTYEYWAGTASYTFKIIYKYNGIKERPILYYDDIKKINNLSAISEIANKYLSDLDYYKFFLKKYVVPLADIKDDSNTIKIRAKALYEDQWNKIKLDKFIYSYISKNINKFDTKKEIYYTRLRDMYFDLKYLNKVYESPTIEDEIIEIKDDVQFKKTQ